MRLGKDAFSRWWAADTPPGYRYQAETFLPAEYLLMSYYERMLTAMTNLMLKHGMITAAELETGKPVAGTRKGELITAAQVPVELIKSQPAIRDLPIKPGFHVGQQVRTRNLNPITHTRLPRYARGKTGMIQQDHGVFNFEDTADDQLGDKPQHVYSVRFAARELWGEQANVRDCVYVDMWEDYLEPA